jgi:flagellar motor switch protein FliG
MVNWSHRLLAFTLMIVGVLQAAPAAAASRRQAEVTTKRAVKNKLEPLLRRYCESSCKILDVRVELDEILPEQLNIGFETPANFAEAMEYEVKKVVVEIQIDQMVDETNQRRLEQLLLLNLKSIGLNQEILWNRVEIPTIGQEEAFSVARLRERGHRRLQDAIRDVIDKYCPNQCILERIDIVGRPVSGKSFDQLTPGQVIRDADARRGFKIDQVAVDLTMDEAIPAVERQRITRVLKAKTRFYTPVSFDIALTAFPVTYLDKKKQEEKQQEDPYGLEKLRQMLIMFRDLAGTKEIITTTEKSLKTDQTTKTETETTETSNKETSSQRLDTNRESTNQSGLTTEEMAACGAGLILLLALMAIALMKFSQANRTARDMVAASQQSGQSAPIASPYAALMAPPYPAESTGASPEAAQQAGASADPVRQQLKRQSLRDEVLQTMMEQPKVARETFSRLIREDGVEVTAKYVHLFGHVVVFELLNDPTLQRELYELSEYYHRSNFRFDAAEELDLLERLKVRLTASEIRVLSRKSSEKFDFLGKLDAGQIHNLIVNEKPQVQSIVLTQLERKKRSAVFDMFRGQAKVDLLSELSMADAIPKEYMSNVAQALQRKVKSSPEYDTENLRSSDILLDLLEKSDLDDQRRLMRTLQQNNAETARSLKMKLVTVEILPYLKDGHLLEVILGMERESLLMFLAGTADHIRELLLNKAPEELAHSWLEDLDAIGNVDEAGYRMAEMKVLGRIRSFAGNGVINLLAINDMIFGYDPGDSAAPDASVNLKIPSSISAA